MRTLKLILLALLTTLSPLAVLAESQANGVISANAGTTWVLGLTDDPSLRSHTVDGLAQLSLVGNCQVHFDVLIDVSSTPWKLEGSMRFVSSDGKSILRMDLVSGWIIGDPANPLFGNFHYDGVIAGGEGKFAGARGGGEINGAALFTSATTGKATWLFRGNVFTHPSE